MTKSIGIFNEIFYVLFFYHLASFNQQILACDTMTKFANSLHDIKNSNLKSEVKDYLFVIHNPTKFEQSAFLTNVKAEKIVCSAVKNSRSCEVKSIICGEGLAAKSITVPNINGAIKETNYDFMNGNIYIKITKKEDNFNIYFQYTCKDSQKNFAIDNITIKCNTNEKKFIATAPPKINFFNKILINQNSSTCSYSLTTGS